jgi:hypothetical protein
MRARMRLTFLFFFFFLKKKIQTGFDGQVFKFDGKRGHVYNLISTPFLQFNALLDTSRDAEGSHVLNTVVRSVACLWEQFSVYFSVSHEGYL